MWNSLASAEVYVTIVKVFRGLEMELFEAERDDMTIICDAFIGHPKKESKGVRVDVSKKWDRI